MSLGRPVVRFLVLAAALLAVQLGPIVSPHTATATASACSAFTDSVPESGTPPVCVVRGGATCYECVRHVTGDPGYFLCAEKADPGDGSDCAESPDVPPGWGSPGDSSGGDDGGDTGGDEGGDDGGGGDGAGGGGDGGVGGGGAPGGDDGPVDEGVPRGRLPPSRP